MIRCLSPLLSKVSKHMTTLTKWTRPDSYIGPSWEGYYSAGFGQSRDSDALERSNFRIAWERISAASERVEKVRENHWAVGWVEWIAIPEDDTEAIRRAETLIEDRESYPVLDEDDFSNEEEQEAQEVWANCYSVKERIAYIRKYRRQFECRSLADLLGCVRGHYFAGYASELL